MADEHIADEAVLAALPPTPESWLTQYVVHGQRQLACPLIFHVGVGLSVLAASCPHLLSIGAPAFIRPTPPNIFALIVGGSGAQKTHAVELGRDFLNRACPDVVPPIPGSEELFVKRMETQPVQCLIYGELGSFLRVTTSESYRAPLREKFTEAFDGNEISAETLKRKHTQRNPQLTLLGACTPRHLLDYTYAMDWEGGFMSRFFFCYGQRQRSQHYPGHDPERREWLHRRLFTIARCNIAGDCKGFDVEGDALWTAFNREIEDLRRVAPERSRGAIGRTILQACKILILLAWDHGPMRFGSPWYFTADLVRPAIALARLHLQGVVALTRRIAPTPEAREIQEVYSCVDSTFRSVAEILQHTQMGSRKLGWHLKTLEARMQVEKTVQGEHTFYRRRANVALPVFDADLQGSAPVGVASVGAPAIQVQATETPAIRVQSNVVAFPGRG